MRNRRLVEPVSDQSTSGYKTWSERTCVTLMLRHTRDKQLAPQTGLKQALMGERRNENSRERNSSVQMQLSLCTGAYGQFMKRLLEIGNLRNLSTWTRRRTSSGGTGCCNGTRLNQHPPTHHPPDGCYV
jgi:hypothetical protein